METLIEMNTLILTKDYIYNRNGKKNECIIENFDRRLITLKDKYTIER